MTDKASQNGSVDSTASSLLLRVKAKDQDAWRRLADLYGPLVYHWCRSHVRQPEDAADILQEVFSAVARTVDGFLLRRNGGTFRGWLYTITRNKIHDYYRGKAQRIDAAGGSLAHELLQMVAGPDDESLDETYLGETVNLFHRALEMVRCEFEDRTWQAFWRAAVENESTTEIAADLGITANGVRQAKSRVLRRLRQELGDAD